jgi:hypothetical protein
MNIVLSFLISAGIIAFGLWALANSIDAGASVGLTLMSMVPVVIGSISFYDACREARLAQNVVTQS